MDKRFLHLVSFFIGFILIPVITFGASSFYEGKTIRIIVGTSPGGGFDIYARILARHIGKHILGNPTIIVENMPGAGGMIAANYLYRIAKPNGLTIGHFNGTLLFDQVLGQEGAEFDSQKFEYIGSLAKVTAVCILSKVSGITNIDQWMNSKTSVKLGGVGLGNLAPDNTPKILKVAVGLPIQLISGYKGTADIRLAVEGKEVAGCFLGWESAKATWRKDLETGNAFVILQAVPKPLPDLQRVPLAINLAKTDEARNLIEVGIHSNSIFARPFVLTPGTPKEQIQILRNALRDTLKNKEFLAETEKAKLELDPVTGEELGKAVFGLSKVDPVLLAKLKEILFK
jgi:tripartite-type tricarboxylate transporter receptor subunit TctC